MANDQDLGTSDIVTDKLTEEFRKALKESVMDYVGHFSTASAILAGFYMATCAFIISIRATESDVFAFLEEPLLAEIPFLADIAMELLAILNISDLYPTHFEYMLLILISLFLLSLISYACFLYSGILQMLSLKTNRTVPEGKILSWQSRGTGTLLISLMFSFISLPWALLRFIYVNSFVMSFLLLFIVISCLIIAYFFYKMIIKIISTGITQKS